MGDEMTEQKEKLAQKVERITQEIERAKIEIASCRHEFGKPEPTIKQIHDFLLSHYAGTGYDPEPIYLFIPKEESGWTRTCGKCGYSEYSNKTRPIVTDYNPDFGN